MKSNNVLHLFCRVFEDLFLVGILESLNRVPDDDGTRTRTGVGGMDWGPARNGMWTSDAHHLS